MDTHNLRDELLTPFSLSLAAQRRTYSRFISLTNDSKTVCVLLKNGRSKRSARFFGSMYRRKPFIFADFEIGIDIDDLSQISVDYTWRQNLHELFFAKFDIYAKLRQHTDPKIAAIGKIEFHKLRREAIPFFRGCPIGVKFFFIFLLEFSIL